MSSGECERDVSFEVFVSSLDFPISSLEDEIRVSAADGEVRDRDGMEFSEENLFLFLLCTRGVIFFFKCDSDALGSSGGCGNIEPLKDLFGKDKGESGALCYGYMHTLTFVPQR